MDAEVAAAPAEHRTAATLASRPLQPDGPREPERGDGVRRAIDLLSTYLPLVLMALLALGSWWLVEHTPLFEADRVAPPLRHVPDYTMTRFLVQRFSADGALTAQLEGDAMRHYPDDDTVEIDNPRIRAIAKDGHVTIATGRSALSNRDASEVQLSGDAHIVREATATEAAIDFRSDYLHYLQATETVRTHLPVVMTQGATQVHGDTLVYDNLARTALLTGKIRAVLVERPRR